MAAVGLVVIGALLVFRLFTPGEEEFAVPVNPAVPLAPNPPVSAAVPPAFASAPSTPVDPALIRNPFCPLVATAAASGSAPVVCRQRSAPEGRQRIGLQDIFVEGSARLARMHVGPVTFPNLHEGETFAGSFLVVSLSDRCGDFEAEGQPFSLCEGEETFK